MGRVSVAARPASAPFHLGASLGAAALATALATITALGVVAAPGALRLLCAFAIALFLVTLSLARPAAGVVATFVFLVFLAFLRRVLIPEAGWSSVDPLLLVGPLVAAVLLVRLFFLERRPLAPDLISKLVVVLLGLTFLEVLNPSGGLASGIVGLLFTAVPLLWFFIGRELVSESLTDRLLRLIVVLGAVVAAYGLLQTEIGHPPWDVDWVNINGYESLNVGGEIRAFGTFSSSAEYGLFVGSALAAAAAFVLQGRALALLALPVLGLALFLASGRAALITALFAVLAVVALRTRRPVTAVVVVVAAAGLAFGAIKVFGSDISSAGAASGNELISHQLGGITDPLNPDSSTLLLHGQLVWDGVKSSIHHPLGTGTGTTSRAAGLSKDENARSTEVDLSNAFVAFGPAGGVLYVGLVALVLLEAVRGYFAGKEFLLPVIGVLIVGLGQWLTGGHYALSPLTWLLIGSLAACVFYQRRGEVEER
jgi:hypothetical protein